MSDLPEGWACTKVGDLLEPRGLFDGPFGSSLKTADYVEVGVRVVRLENLANLRFIDDKRTFISVAKYESLRKHTVVAGDIMFGSFLDGLPRVCILPTLDSPAIAKADCFCVRARIDLVQRACLAYYLGRSAIRESLLEEVHGATRPRITTKQLRAVEVALPPLAEQQRIVEKVDALLTEVNAARARLDKVPSLLKRFRRSVLAAACSGGLTQSWREAHASAGAAENPPGTSTLIEGDVEDGVPDLPEIPDGWTVTSLGDVAERIQYGCNAKASSNALRGVPVLRMGNIQDGRIEVSDLKYVTPGEAADEFRLMRGDLIFNRTNSPELVGKAAVFDRDDRVIFASYLIRVRPRREVLRSELLCYWINSPWGRAWARAVRTDGVSQSNINASKLALMPLPLPPLNEQHEIVRRVGDLFAAADAVEARVVAAAGRADRLTQSVLAKAFRGELVPTEADLARQEGREYQTASVLLRRIKDTMSSDTRAAPRCRAQKRESGRVLNKRAV